MTDATTSLPRRPRTGRCAAPSAGAARGASPPSTDATTEIDKQRVPMSARPYRLLALVKQDAVVRVQKEPDDTVMTWPHLLPSSSSRPA